MGLDASFCGGTLVPYLRLTPPLSLFCSIPALSVRSFSDPTGLRLGGTHKR